jgi:nucleoside-diphosphate-sugar epimerase
LQRLLDAEQRIISPRDASYPNVRPFDRRARGFVGRQITKALAARRVEVRAVSSASADPSIPARAWYRVNLIDKPATEALVNDVRPTHLDQAAWDTTVVKAFRAAAGRWLVARQAHVTNLTEGGLALF